MEGRIGYLKELESHSFKTLWNKMDISVIFLIKKVKIGSEMETGKGSLK